MIVRTPEEFRAAVARREWPVVIERGHIPKERFMGGIERLEKSCRRFTWWDGFFAGIGTGFVIVAILLAVAPAKAAGIHLDPYSGTFRSNPAYVPDVGPRAWYPQPFPAPVVIEPPPPLMAPVPPQLSPLMPPPPVAAEPAVAPPPLGLVYTRYTVCPEPRACPVVFVSVGADGLNVRDQNGAVSLALVNGTPLRVLGRNGPWTLVAPACDLAPTGLISWTAGVPLIRCN